MLTGEIAFFTTKFPSDADGTFALEKSHHLGHFVLWWYLNEHMDMVVHKITLQNLAVLLASQRVKYFSKPGPNVAVQFLFSHLGDEDKVVFAVPLGVR